ncbi:MAG: hypothetical protein ACLQVD_12080 [Capsulimonadaceae bacterium]
MARLGEVGEVDDATNTVPETAGIAVETESIKDNITDLYEGLREVPRFRILRPSASVSIWRKGLKSELCNMRD